MEASRSGPQPDGLVRLALLKHDIEECEEAEPQWDAVWNRAVAAKNLVDLDRHDYHQAAVLTMITINRDSNRVLLLMASEVKDADARDLDKAQAGSSEFR